MFAAWYDTPGPARDVLRTGHLPDPAPRTGEVLVRLKASGINPSDVKRRAAWGKLRDLDGRTIPHSDGAGVIEAVGDGVNAARIGERVWIRNALGGYGKGGRREGTAAELIAIDAANTAPLPAGTDFAVGACLGVPALTAHRSVFADGSVEGQFILVAGGAGAVAHHAVQMARLGGARVAATAGNEDNIAVCKDAGAELALNYKSDDIVEQILHWTNGKGVERIVEVDFAANIERDAAMLADNGTIACYSSTSNPQPSFPYYPLAFKGANLRIIQGFLLPDEARRAGIADIANWLERNELATRIDGRFALSDIAAAHERVESGRARGNVVIDLTMA